MTTRAIQRLAARIGIAVLLFAQLAVSAHACTALTGPLDDTRAVAADSLHAAMPGCEEADSNDSGNSVLCLKHCQSDSQSVNTSSQAGVPAVALPPPLIVAQIRRPCETDNPVLASLLERETSPPPLLRFCVLRI
jgi:hypothetical protein